ncbi:MAG: DUF2341 domain-containing protein [Candidatus Brocadiia bacterium]
MPDNRNGYLKIVLILLFAAGILSYGGFCQDEANKVITGSSIIPQNPSNLVATVISDSEIDLAWSDNSPNEGGFIIERKTSQTATFQVLATVTSNVTTYADTNVAELTNYFYRVTAFNAVGQSDPSNEVALVAPWTIVTIDSQDNTGNYPSMGMDNNNKLHIAYYDATKSDLKYATNISGTWATEIIDGLNSNTGDFPSLAIDNSGKVHISYFDQASSYLKYATNISGLWQTSTVDYGSSAGFYTSIAVDSNGKAHISYFDSVASAVKYATNATGSWAITTVDSAGYTGLYTSITLDRNNKVHISYYDQTNGDLKYASNYSGSWVMSTIDSAGDVGYFTDIAHDALNKIHIVYYDRSNGDLKYATNKSGVWVTSSLDMAGDVGKYPSITLDGNNTINVCYQDVTNLKLKYLRENGGAYQIVTVDDNGENNSIVIGPTGVHIAYFDGRNRDLKYASNSNVLWQVMYPPSELTATGISPTQIDLVWKDNSNNENGFSIERRRADESSFIEIATVITDTTSFSDIGLNPATFYYYRVKGFDGPSQTIYSNEVSTRTKYNSPGTPVLVSPGDGAEAIAINPVFTWVATTDTLFYKLQVGITPVLSITVLDQSNLTRTSYAYTQTLNRFTTYYWWVKSINLDSESSWSTVYSFTTILSVPTLSNPGNNATLVSVNPSLNWNLINGADSYDIQLANDSLFSSPTVFTSTSASYAPLNLNLETLYYWRVRAARNNQSGEWSTPYGFTTIMAAPSVPALVSPVDNAVAIPPAGALFTWNAVTAAVTYNLQVASDFGFSSLVINQSGISTTSTLISTLQGASTYYWRVAAVNPGGTSAWSTSRLFSTMITTPSLLLPTNNAETVSLMPTLSWSSSSYATAYNVQVAGDSNFSALIVDLVGLVSTIYQTSQLAYNTSYYWRVQAGRTGETTGWSAPYKFTTLLAKPNPVTPTHSSSMIQVNPTFSWTSVAGAASYTLQVSNAIDFLSTIVNQGSITSISYQASGLNYYNSYYWRVKAVGVNNSSDWSSISQFSTTLTSPGLISPTNNATCMPTTMNITWGIVNGASSYTIYFSANQDFSTYSIYTSTGTSCLVGGLNTSTVYYWKVRADNNDGSSGWSEVRHFTTQPPLPAQTTLVSPVDEATRISTDPVMKWNASEFSLTYSMQVSTDSQFNNLVLNTDNLVGTTKAISGLNTNTVYYWRLRGVGSEGIGSWSDTWSFTTIPATPAQPVLLTPVTGITGIALPVTFTWQVSSNASSYHLKVSDSMLFTNLLIDRPGITETMYAPPDGILNWGGIYYWQLQAAGNTGELSDWSTVGSFRVIGVPLLNSPVSGTLISDGSVLLTWTPANDNSLFRVQLSKDPGFSTIFSDQTNMAGTSYTASNLVRFNTYYWRICGINVNGISAWSSPWSITKTLTNSGNNTWAYYRPITLTNSTSTLTNYAVAINPFTDSNFINNTGLVGSWHFSEESGNSTADMSGYNNIGTLVSGIDRVAGISGNALQFNGASSYLIAGSSSTLAPSQFTLESWFNMAATPAPSSYIMFRPNCYFLELYPGTYALWLYNGTSYQGINTGSFAPALDTWVHFVATYDGATAKLYVNGVEKGSGVLSYTPSATQQLRFGASNVPSNFFNGNLDEVRIYNRALFLSEIQSRYNAGSPKIRLDYADVRFTDASGLDSLPYWQELDTRFWVKIPSLPSGNTGIRMYYGNNLAETESSLNNTFVWSDDFSGNTLNTDTKWVKNDSGGWVSQNDKLIFSGGSSTWGNPSIYSMQTFGRTDSLMLEFDYKGTFSDYSTMFGWKNTGTATDYPNLIYGFYSNASGTDDIFEEGTNRGDVGKNWVSNQYYKIRMPVKTGGGCKYQMSVNGGNSWITWYDSTYSLEANLRVAIIHHHNSFEIDNLRVRKYVSSEPSSTTGSQEFNLSIPVNFIANVVSTSRIDLSWQDFMVNEDGFKIERSLDGVNYSVLANVNANTTSYSDAGLNSGTAYYYRIKAYRFTGGDGAATVATASTVIPVAPSNLITTTVRSSAITMNWADNSNNEAGFEVWRSVDGVNYTLLATLARNTTSYTDSGLLMAASYAYRISAYNGIGRSDYSNLIIETILVVEATGGTVTYLGDYAINTFTSSGTFAITAGVNAQVLMVGGGGAGGGRHGGGGGGGGVLHMPSITISPGSYPIVVGAGAPTNTGGTGVAGANGSDSTAFNEIAKGGGGGGSYSGINGIAGGSGGGAGHSATNGGAATQGNPASHSGTGYGNLGPNNPSAGNEACGGGGAGAPGQASVGESYGGAGGAGIPIAILGDTYYWGGGGGGGGWEQVAGNGGIGGGGGGGFANTTYTDANYGLGGGSAINSGQAGYHGDPGPGGHGGAGGANTGGGGGGSGQNNWNAYTGNGGAGGSGIVIVKYLTHYDFNITTNLIAQVSSETSVKLTWQDNSPWETGFKIERSLDGIDWVQINTVLANTTVYTDTSVSATTNYYYRVRSYTPLVNHPYSNTEPTRTSLPAAPANLITTTVSSSFITIQWNDVSNENSFEVWRTTDGTNYNLAATLNRNVISYTDNSVVMATTYAYKVRAYNGIGYSNYSNVICDTTSVVKATGGTVTNSGNYKTHTFTSSGTFIVISGNGNVEALVVGGGGAGGGNGSGNNIGGGGGGGGGVVYNPSFPVTVQSYSVTVGAGGIGTTGNPTNGGNSVFSSLTAIGGGYGGGWNGSAYYSANSGGSGGGGIYSLNAGASGTTGQGNSGGNGATPINYPGGGGGGAGAVGQTAPNNNAGGNGGIGFLCNITGSPIYYAGGGGGGLGASGNSGVFGVGGNGGGGNGSASSVGTNGTPNTGGGGGGAGNNMGSPYSNAKGGDGGSGIVIIRYLASSGIVATGGTIMEPNTKIHTFISSGTLNVTSGGNVEVLVVAGGGGGGMDMGGGGGGGGVIYNPSYTITAGVMNITVGAGGTGAPAAGTNGQPSAHQYTIPAQNGGNSIFGTLTAIGGGFGGSSYQGYTPGIAGGNGGSGGGSSGYNDTAATFYGGTGTAGQGYRGGNSTATYYSGGGGGAGGQGTDSPAQPDGGPGVLNSILGTAYYWGGGGGGASYSLSNGGNGGIGGGGGGAVGTTTGGAGLNNGSPGGGGSPNTTTNTPGGNAGANTGGGGGGGSHYNANNRGGNGGSGIVIVKYFDSGDNVTTNLVAKVNTVAEIVLTWQDNSPSENGFKVERSPDGSAWAQITDLPANTTVYTDTGVFGGNTYYYRVYSYNFLLNHPYCQIVTSTIPAIAPSGLITNTVGPYNIVLQWVDNSNNETGFKLERSLNGTDWTELTAILVANTTSHNDETGLSRDTQYYYRIRAYNGLGNSSYSNTLLTRTLNFTFIGNGKDGTITLGAGNWHTTNYGNNGGQPEGYTSYINSSVSGGTTTIPVVATAGFNATDEVLIHFGHSTNSTTRDNYAGMYYFTKVSSKTSSTIVVQDGIPWAVNSANDRVQVTRVPNYTNVTINGVVIGNGWDWYQYGIVCFKATGTVTFSGSGSINYSKLGYQTTWLAPGSDTATNATPGTGYNFGLGTPGGGGGGTHGHYGGYGVGGSSTSSASSLWKSRAALLGTNDMGTRSYLGSSGGWGAQNHGGSQGDSNQRGGYGGGIVWIGAYTINFSNLTGCIQANGEGGRGIPGSGWWDGGGGGSGGSVIIKAYTIQNMAVNSLSATGGGGAAVDSGGSARHGEDGQITRGGNGGTYNAGGSGSTSGSGGGGGGHSGAGEAGQATYGGRGGTGNSPGGAGGGGAGRIRIDYHTVNGTVFNGLVPIPTQAPTVGYAIDANY